MKKLMVDRRRLAHSYMIVYQAQLEKVEPSLPLGL